MVTQIAICLMCSLNPDRDSGMIGDSLEIIKEKMWTWIDMLS